MDTRVLNGSKLTDQVLAAGRETLAAGQVIEELINVRAERGDRAGRHEAVRLLRAAVGAVPQIPICAIDGGRGDLRADGVDATVFSEPVVALLVQLISHVKGRKVKGNIPDHQLVITTVSHVVDIRSREQIVRNIGVDAGVGVAPDCRRLELVDIADQRLGQEIVAVGVALDFAAAARPLPLGRP